MPEKTNCRFPLVILDTVLFLLLTAFDQITKTAAVHALKGRDPFVIIPGVIQFRYLENHGAAWSLFNSNSFMQPVFAMIAIAAVILIACMLPRIPADRHFRLFRICLIGIASGAAGNLIDRLVLHYVRDFIYFNLIDFPIFNVADSYVSVATVLIIIMVLFVYKDEDFRFLKKKG